MNIYFVYNYICLYIFIILYVFLYKNFLSDIITTVIINVSNRRSAFSLRHFYRSLQALAVKNNYQLSID